MSLFLAFARLQRTGSVAPSTSTLYYAGLAPDKMAAYWDSAGAAAMLHHHACSFVW
eukprot:gene6092-6330_t